MVAEELSPAHIAKDLRQNRVGMGKDICVQEAQHLAYRADLTLEVTLTLSRRTGRGNQKNTVTKQI